MEDCIFCKIIRGEIPSNKVYEDEKVLVFHDISPMSPVHLLVIPKQHICGANEIDDSNSDIVGHIFEVARKVAEEFHLDSGYRIVTNVGDDAGQTVHHLHFHILGGKKLKVEMC